MSEQLETGDLLEGRYRITSELGRGGFGVVFKGEQISTGQYVAIKVLHAQPADSDSKGQEHEARFKREMQLIARLKHPNIVRLIDTGRLENGALYTVLELIEGVPLNELLAKEGALSVRSARGLMMQVLDALCCAHALGVVHRDLKPANIMVSDTGGRRNAMVLDFGIAGIVEDARNEDYRTLTEEGGLCGTPSYMSPEQFSRQPVSPKSDIYAWALVFLECLSGETVFNGDSIGMIIYQQMSPLPVRMPQNLVSHPLGAIIQRASAKSPDERSGDSQGLLLELEDCVVSDLAGITFTLPSSSTTSSLDHLTPAPMPMPTPMPNGLDETRDGEGAPTAPEALKQREVIGSDSTAGKTTPVLFVVASLLGLFAVVLVVIFVFKGKDSGEAQTSAPSPAPAATAPDVASAAVIAPDTSIVVAPPAPDTSIVVAPPAPETTPAPPTGPEIELVEVGPYESKIGLSSEARDGAVEQYSGSFDGAAWDFAGSIVTPEATFELKKIKVMAREMTWGDWQNFSRVIDPVALEEVCPNGLPMSGSAGRPITRFSFDEARFVCQKLGMRLPTYREWEAIARGEAGGRVFSFGEKITAAQRATLADRSTAQGSDWNMTPEGVRDLSASVSEWVECGDLTSKTFCPQGMALRGGSWMLPEAYWTAFSSVGRVNQKSGAQKGDPEDLRCYQGQDVGFRCVVDVD